MGKDGTKYNRKSKKQKIFLHGKCSKKRGGINLKQQRQFSQEGKGMTDVPSKYFAFCFTEEQKVISLRF